MIAHTSTPKEPRRPFAIPVSRLILRLGLVACFAAGQSGLAAERAVSGDSYTAPNKQFSCAVASLMHPARMQDEFYGDEFSLTFTDDFGQLYRIDGYRQSIPPSIAALSVGRGRIETFFREVTLPNYLAAVAKARVAEQEFVADLKGGALVVIFWLPGGSTTARMVNGEPAERLDTLRAVVIFAVSDRIIQVDHQPMQLGLVEDNQLQEPTSTGWRDADHASASSGNRFYLVSAKNAAGGSGEDPTP